MPQPMNKQVHQKQGKKKTNSKQSAHTTGNDSLSQAIQQIQRNPDTTSPQFMMALQQTIGNHAVQHMIAQRQDRSPVNETAQATAPPVIVNAHAADNRNIQRLPSFATLQNEKQKYQFDQNDTLHFDAIAASVQAYQALPANTDDDDRKVYLEDIITNCKCWGNANPEKKRTAEKWRISKLVEIIKNSATTELRKVDPKTSKGVLDKIVGFAKPIEKTFTVLIPKLRKRKVMPTQAMLLESIPNLQNDPTLDELYDWLGDYHDERAKDDGSKDYIKYCVAMVETHCNMWLRANPPNTRNNAQKQIALVVEALRSTAKQHRKRINFEKLGKFGTSPAKDESGANDPNNQDKLKEDMMYEVMAKQIAYNGVGGAEGLLNHWGYETHIYGKVTKDDFQVALLMPTIAGQAQGRYPVLAFKGTKSPNEWWADLDITGVGFTTWNREFAQVKELVKEAANGSPDNKRVDVTGHSLGGAYAQYAAVDLPYSVRRAVTFQSAAIRDDIVSQFAMQKRDERKKDDQQQQDMAQVTHHVAKWDPVPMGGLGHLEGESYLHDVGQTGLLSGIAKAHGAFFFASRQYKSLRAQLGLTGDVLELIKMPISEEVNEVEKFEKDHPYNKSAGKLVRAAELGRFLVGLLKLPLYLPVKKLILDKLSKNIKLRAGLSKPGIENTAAFDAKVEFQKLQNKLIRKQQRSLKKDELQKTINTILKKDSRYKSPDGILGIQNAITTVWGNEYDTRMDDKGELLDFKDNRITDKAYNVAHPAFIKYLRSTQKTSGLGKLFKKKPDRVSQKGLQKVINKLLNQHKEFKCAGGILGVQYAAQQIIPEVRQLTINPDTYKITEIYIHYA